MIQHGKLKNNSIQIQDENTINIRGQKIPVIDCYKKLGLKRPSMYKNDVPCALIISTEWDKSVNCLAVFVDDIFTNLIYHSKIGLSVSAKDNVFSKYTRDCWDSTEVEQIQFIDWNKLIR